MFNSSYSTSVAGVALFYSTFPAAVIASGNTVQFATSGGRMLPTYTDLYEEEPMPLQDDLRAENLEVADTGSLLTQAADRIDELETLLTAAADPARIADLEQALSDIQTLIVGVL